MGVEISKADGNLTAGVSAIQLFSKLQPRLWMGVERSQLSA
jgi:hypothetical protein